ncbi:alpha/beta fold hydrolase [Qipengyuania sp. DSG2-2]|uniref:alpha/beta fold hydrolase n=1 Tax=Qipengyuania sp. DGS2-2 TaxID=3349631 RepID=UPI0036D36010
MPRATVYRLPKSNQRERRAIIHQDQTAAAPFNRRAIPDAASESRWQAADGHAIRRIDWAVPGGDAPPRGSILFLPGRGDHYEKYLETLDEWHRDGWRVTASDWRGQGESGRLGKDAVTGHISDFAIWTRDLAHLWAQWIAETPGPHVLAGHSMGGHLVLRTVAEGRIKPDAMVLSAPMLGFPDSIVPQGVTHAAARLMAAVGDPARPAWKWSEKPGEPPAARIALLTHDEKRYADELWWREQRPDLVMGPGSWGWVERALASIRWLGRPDILAKIDIPVLIVATSNDRLVSWKAVGHAVRHLPKGELAAFGDEAHHEILRECDAVRDRAMMAIARFLDRAAPAES